MSSSSLYASWLARALCAGRTFREIGDRSECHVDALVERRVGEESRLDHPGVRRAGPGAIEHRAAEEDRHGEAAGAEAEELRRRHRRVHGALLLRRLDQAEQELQVTWRVALEKVGGDGIVAERVHQHAREDRAVGANEATHEL